MHILTRRREPLPMEVKKELAQKVRDACVQPGDFQSVNHQSKYLTTKVRNR
jgi:hypothetical protein